MTNRIAIISAGGHARSVADIVFSLPEYRLVSFVDTPRSENEEIFGVPVIELPKPFSEIRNIDCFTLGQGSNYRRSEEMDRLSASGIPFPAIIHPTAYIGHDVEIGAGTVVMPGAILNASARVGRGCVINSGCVIKHGVQVADYASVSPGAAIAADVVIGSYAFIGIGATVNSSLTIGDNTVVGAGAVVVKDLEPGILAIGTPARPVRKILAGWSPV